MQACVAALTPVRPNARAPLQPNVLEHIDAALLQGPLGPRAAFSLTYYGGTVMTAGVDV